MTLIPAQRPASVVPRMAFGGTLSMSEAVPWFERREASQSFHPEGLLNSSVPGRTDQLQKTVLSGSYVVPADVVSGLGEGNTLAGSSVIDKMMHSMPHGVAAPHLTHGRGAGIPPAPRAYSEPKTPLARGGAAPTPVILAGGEHVISPEDIIRKFGNLERGHKILDHFVVHVRKKTIKQMRKLKGPRA